MAHQTSLARQGQQPLVLFQPACRDEMVMLFKAPQMVYSSRIQPLFGERSLLVLLKGPLCLRCHGRAAYAT